MKKYIVTLIGIVVFMTSCFQMQNKYEVLAPGPWRAVLKLENNYRPLNKKAKPIPQEQLKFEEVTQGELPFVFELSDKGGKLEIEIINGEERIKVPSEDILYGHDIKTGDDSIRINFPYYDSYISALYEEDVIEGKWVVTTRDNYSIPFVAKQGMNHRFTNLKKAPVMDVSGKWEVLFTELNDPTDTYKAIGEFKQDGNYLTGTFLTETGDYRFLEGTIQANKLYLSVFDGSHAFLFEAKILEDETMIGTFRSGTHYKNTWTAKKNPEASLANPDELTFLKEGYDKIEFEFSNLDGKKISLDNPAYKDKVRIVQIIGTWCPNCADETRFLSNYLKQNKNDDLKVIGLAYEKHKDKEKANAAIKRFKKRFDIEYEVVHAGENSKTEAAKTLPMLNHILSYPTMIFIDKKGAVRKIHTGFAGPATSEFPAFEEEFDTFVKELLAE